jgi:hypothetical protein
MSAVSCLKTRLGSDRIGVLLKNEMGGISFDRILR